ncbi:hypothetical protein P872_01840 [Rhodonellum psychrophilum GCM71 = DSM 17998]|uniref:Uncharacterized protein n=1 Tax=Rhodonellum psychrophilum GCM71 = DSM 17998 TaxID=1123057 RepID=U5BT67_9BACT|nr:hypothetical protein P872_01840 [Rhodonellum psychrophilum GCM71 = DSM 17998]
MEKKRVCFYKPSFFYEILAINEKNTLNRVFFSFS